MTTSAQARTSAQAKRPQRLRVEVVLDPGPDLFSQGPTSRVSSALVGLTAVFGMGTGVTPPLQGPRRQLYQARDASGKAAPIGSDVNDGACALFPRHLGAFVVDLFVEGVIVSAVLLAAAGGGHM